jgi:hypothetical protein
MKQVDLLLVDKLEKLTQNKNGKESKKKSTLSYSLYYYYRNPEVISRVKNSSEALANVWSTAVEADSASYSYLHDVIFEHGLGITDATEDESDWIANWKNDNIEAINDLTNQLSDMVSRRALIGVSRDTQKKKNQQKTM